jgi:hypothetical protein
VDVPFLVTPDGLERLRGELVSAASSLDAVGAGVGRSAIDADWQGTGQHAYAERATWLTGLCRDAAGRLAAEARRVAGLEEQLFAELAVLRRLEHEVADTLDRLALAAASDAGGTLRAALTEIRDHLPLTGSPAWHEVSTRVLGLVP